MSRPATRLAGVVDAGCQGRPPRLFRSPLPPGWGCAVSGLPRKCKPKATAWSRRFVRHFLLRGVALSANPVIDFSGSSLQRCRAAFVLLACSFWMGVRGELTTPQRPWQGSNSKQTCIYQRYLDLMACLGLMTASGGIWDSGALMTAGGGIRD